MSLERCFSIHGRDRSDGLNYEGDVAKREDCVIAEGIVENWKYEAF